jgi:hypothetical protein
MDVQREEPDEGVVMRVINGILSQLKSEVSC